MGYLLSKANLDLCFEYFNKQELIDQRNDSFCVILRPHHFINKPDYYHNKNNTQEFVMVRTTFKSHKSYFHFFAEKQMESKCIYLCRPSNRTRRQCLDGDTSERKEPLIRLINGQEMVFAWNLLFAQRIHILLFLSSFVVMGGVITKVININK